MKFKDLEIGAAFVSSAYHFPLVKQTSFQATKLSDYKGRLRFYPEPDGEVVPYVEPARILGTVAALASLIGGAR